MQNIRLNLMGCIREELAAPCPLSCNCRERVLGIVKIELESTVPQRHYR